MITSDMGFLVESFIPRIYLSNEASGTLNEDRMPSYVPGKLMYQFTQTGPIVLALHILGLGFWMFRVFHCFLIINRPPGSF